MTPLCPVTGLPAVRLVQWIKARFLADLWRVTFGVDAHSSFGTVIRFGLWESPTGLYFFDPPAEGDHEFYRSFYARLRDRGLWNEQSTRPEFASAARFIAPGARVLDVGCGFGNFRHVVPQADYVGLDPNFAADSAVAGVRGETLAEHLVEHADAYDAVCAFHVVEHLATPVQLFAEMLRAARPGGLAIVAVPQVPSAHTRIPNYAVNAPPHHLTWWTKPALRALAEQSGAAVETIERVPWGRNEALVYWIERCSPIHCRDAHYRNALTWHAAALIGYLGGRLMHALRRAPAGDDEGAALLLVARRPL
jgi:SAM-dependent methyltransferase